MRRLPPFCALLGTFTLQALSLAHAAPLPPSPYDWLLYTLPSPQSLSRYLPAGFACPAPPTPREALMSRATAQAGGLLGCGNEVGPLVYFPNPEPAYSAQAPTPHGGFDSLAAHIRGAKQEVLLSTMFWEEGQDYPSEVLLRAILDLRGQVKMHPEQYPRGVTVRLLLGNAVGEGGNNTDPLRSLSALLRGLQRLGLPLPQTGPGQPEAVPGFRLEVSNWAYFMPHNHVKLLVIDGQEVAVGGYNITAQHLPPPHPGSQNVHDLALWVRGPLARQSAAIFDDLWLHSRPVSCTLQKAGAELYCPPNGMNTASTHTWLADPMPTGTGWVFPMYRRNGFYEGDTAIATLLGSTEQNLDLIQSQVSGGFNCTVTWGAPNGCVFPEDALPMWKAVLEDIEKRHIHVRLLLDPDPGMFRIESSAFIHAITLYLKTRGLGDYLQIKMFGSGRAHTKLILVDRQMAALGSYNLHYSSQGKLGLNEYDVATSDPATVSALQQQFEYEWAKGTPTVLPWWLK